MTWTEIKKAVEEAGIRGSDEILSIECEVREGSKKLRPISQGKFVKLSEEQGESARRDASGCAC